MSTTTEPAPKETTFRSFSQKQGADYAQHRLDYHPRLYNILLSYHESTGGQFGTVVDVGCGPGTAVRTLAPRFAHAVGLDPSEGMIATARSLGGSAASDSEPIRFEVTTIEDASSRLSPPLPDGSVDLLIAATAAHWFDMASFWPLAARLLRPGGSVALWCGGALLVDPGMPKGKELQAALERFEQALDEYIAPGNRVARNRYVDLPLPWTIETPVAEFDRESFLRKEWNIGEGFEPIDEFYNRQGPASVDALVKVMETTSPYIRWREAHPEEVGTGKDPREVLHKELVALIKEAGGAQLKGGVDGVLLMFKKKAE